MNYIDKNTKYNLMDFTLRDEDELINRGILIKEISQFNLVEGLESIKIYKLTDSFVYIPDEFIDYIDSIVQLLEKSDIKGLYNHLKTIEKCINKKLKITQLFPFNQILLDKIEGKGNNPRKIRMFKIIFLIYKMLENKVNFRFNYDPEFIKFEFEKDEVDSFKDLYLIINLNNDFYFENTKLLNKIGMAERTILDLKNVINDKDKIDATNWFYLICNNILDNKIQIDETNKMKEIMLEVNQKELRIVDEITEDFEKEIKENKRTYKITKLLDRPNKNSDIKENILIMKIWYLVLFYGEDKLSSITPFFCLPFEKELLKGISNMYENMNKKLVDKCISFTKNLLEKLKIGNNELFYGNSNTFLYKIQAGFFDYNFVENNEKKSFSHQIEKEKKWYQQLNSYLIEFWPNETFIEKSIACLNSQYLNLKEFVENADQAEKYRNKFNELILRVRETNFEEKESNKERLIKFLESNLSNPTEDIYEKCRKEVDNFIKHLSDNLPKNQIFFPQVKTNTIYNPSEKNRLYVYILDILKNYSSYHKKLTHIFLKTENNLSDILGLDKEIDIIKDILFKYSIGNGNYIKMYEKKVMGIIRALVLYNVINIGKSSEKIQKLFSKILEFPEIINAQVGGNVNKYFNDDILKWTFEKANISNLEDYIIIPKFEPKDFLYLFLIMYKDKKEEGLVDKPTNGFLFKYSKNEKISSILNGNLYKFEFQELDNKEKNQFEDYVKKIGIALFQGISRYNDEINDLSYNDLKIKFEKEKKNLETKKKNELYENEDETIQLEILTAILNCFTLATTYEQTNFSNNKLTYEDKDFFTNKSWDHVLISNYPGMAFWLSKNYFFFYNDLMIKKDFKGCFLAEENRISFWYFQIRIFSNIQTFEYDCYKDKTIEINKKTYNVWKELDDKDENDHPKNEVEKYIKEKITNLTIQKLKVNVKWLNLVLNEIPNELKIRDKNLRYFYEFFALLLSDSNGYQKGIKNQIIIEYLEKVFDLVFDNKIEEIFDKDIEKSDNEILKLINKPQDELRKKIKERNQKKLLETEISENVKKTLNILKEINSSALQILDKIEKRVNDKTKEYHNKYKKKKKNFLDTHEKEFNDTFNQAKKDIKSCLDVIESNELQDQKLLEEKINILDSMKDKNYFDFDPNIKIICYILTIKSYLKNDYKYILKIKNKNTKKNEKIGFESNCTHIYLQASIFSLEDIQDFTIFKDDKTSSRKLNIKDQIESEKFSFAPFDSIKKNSDEQNKLMQDALNNENIFEPKITFNGNEFEKKYLKDIIEKLKKFDTKSLKDTKKYNKDFKRYINEKIDNIDTILAYLNLHISDIRETDPELETNVASLRNLFNDYKTNLKLNLKDINRIISLNQKIEGDGIFKANHDKKVIKFEEAKKYYNINIHNIRYLYYPMISENEKNITFSSKSFKMFLGSYIPSILSTSLIIKLLNLKDNIIKGTIKDSNKDIVTVQDIDNDNNMKICINIKNLKSKELSKENIIFNLEISSENYNSIIVPFNLDLNIVPLSILFSSPDYKLKYDTDNNLFNVCTSIVFSNSNIKFIFKYLYKSNLKNQLNDNVVYMDYSIESLENNNSESKPQINLENNNILLQIPKYKDDKNNHINFILKVYFSSTFYINIRFDAKIINFDFNFKWYSFDSKKLITDEDIVIYIDRDNYNNSNEYILYFKIENIYSNTSIEYQMEPKLPPEIEILTNNFKEEKEKKEFEFYMKLRIKNYIKVNQYNRYYYISVSGNGVTKKLYINLKDIKIRTNRIEDLYNLPRYKYSPSRQNFIEELGIEKESIYITPFNYYIPMVYNLYNSRTFNPNFDKNFKFNVIYFSLEKKIFFKKEYNNDKYRNENFFLKLIGIFEEDYWYPIMIMNPGYGRTDIYQYFEYYQYEDDKIISSIKMLQYITDDSDYWIIPRILKYYYDNEKKDDFIYFINLLPSSIKEELKQELEKLNDNENDKFFPIIVNNLIYKLFILFKNKYKEIRENDDTLFLTEIKLPQKIFSNIFSYIKEKKNEYFQKNEAEFLNFKNESVININDNKKENEDIGNNNYLLQENENPQTIDKIEQKSLEEKSTMMDVEESQQFDLSNISFKTELKIPSQYSLKEIIKYYNNCNKITSILYFYIISATKSEKEEKKKEAGKYYQKLKSIYSQCEHSDYSFFSRDINEFINGFNKLENNLNKIGFACGPLKRLTNDYKNDDNEDTYLIWPDKKAISKDKDYWETEKNIGNNKFNQEEIQTGRLRVNEKYKSNDVNYFPEKNDNESNSENINNNNEEANLFHEDCDLQNLKVIDIDDSRIDNDYDISESIKLEEFPKSLPDNKKKFGRAIDEKKIVDPNNLTEQNFKEVDGIKRAINILEEEKRKKDSNIEQKLDLGNYTKYHKFENLDVLKLNENKKLKIEQLYNKANFLANQLFIEINGNGKIADTLVIFLIDPSVYISEDIKIINLFIICAMTNALNCLEINYSIVLMGDESFRCVLKDYNEPHSKKVLEKVYECLMLRRFRTNIPGCLKYSIEEISVKSHFKNISFFIFTDGLDKSFAYTQKKTWDYYIFNKKSNSFAFIFLLSSVLEKNDKEFLDGIWKEFLKESNNNSSSKIFLESIELLKLDDNFEKIIGIFSSNLDREKNEEQLFDFNYKKPIFKINCDNSISNFLEKNDKNLDLNNRSVFYLNGGSFIKNEKNLSSLSTNKEPLDINWYKNNLHQIGKDKNKVDNETENAIIKFTHKFLNIRSNLNRGILEEIFKPNKANLKVLSNNGTEIDIMALILYFLNPVPDPMIYLQDAIGNVKEYAITIIIDTSFSVLNHFNINHSLNTIRVLLTSFTIIDLPSFDLIVTGEDGPIVLCSEYPTFAALNEKSKLWELLFQCLSNPIKNADLLSTLQTAFDLKRMRTNNFPSFLFVLTDGLFEEEKQNQLKEIVAKLVQTNIQVVGIGLGSYPLGITKIFGQAIFDLNPSNLLHSILNIMEGNINDKNKMDYILNEEENEKKLDTIKSELKSNKRWYFNSLREELIKSPLAANCYDMMNKEIDGGFDEMGVPINPKGDNIALFQPNSLSGQKILIVMLWSCGLSKVENKLLDPKNIYETNEVNSRSIQKIVDYLGIKVKHVLNYEDAIKEITKIENGKCIYYTVWVMCGPKTKKLPDNSKKAGLVEQFIDCLIKYWENGGAVVLFCENKPLYFQANMFLEKIRFKGKIKQTKLRIEGDDKGTKSLRKLKANGNLIYNGTYDASIIKLDNGTPRTDIGFNVPNIYEGETISHANSNNSEDIKPFIPFAKNSSGNICMMIYPTQGKEGDIIIDCGYTKVFINMKTDDSATWRYIQNIACFLSRPEVHMIYDDGETAINYRPNGIYFNIDEGNLYKEFDLGRGLLDIIYMIDSTGSMGSSIRGVKNKCIEILDKFKENKDLKNYSIQFGGVFYRDPVDNKEDIHEFQPLGNVEDLKIKMNSIDAKGGGDTPEDWVGAYKIALDEDDMKWRKNSVKIIIHIADAGAHTLRFSKGDKKHNKPEYEIGLVNLIKKCAEDNITIFGFQIGNKPKQSFNECQIIYNSSEPKASNYEIYELGEFEKLSDEKVAEILEKNIINKVSGFIANYED